MLGPARPLGIWIGLVLTGALLLAGVRIDAHPPRPLSVTAGNDPSHEVTSTSTTAGPELMTTTTAIEENTSTPTTSRARTTTTSAAPATPAVPVASSRGAWLVEGGRARLVAPDLCGNIAKSFTWRSDNSALVSDYTGATMYVGLDGTVQPASPGYRHRISDTSDRGAFLDQDANGRQVLIISSADLRSNRIEVPSSEHGGGYADIVISPDGSTIAMFDFGEYLLVSSSGAVLKPWSPIPIGVDLAAVVSPSPRGWTTDGQWIVLGGTTDLYAMRPDGRGAHALQTGPISWPLGFGPGSSFVYDHTDPADRQVRLASADGSGSRALVSGSGFGVAWSRSGGPVAWSGIGPDGVTGIHTVGVDGEPGPMLLRSGEEIVRYTQKDTGMRSFEASTMAWSADGTRLFAAVC